MNCIIVDDEPLALDLIEDFVSRIPFLEMVGRCTNAYDAIPLLQGKKIDIMFLDIQMPHLNGIEFVKSLDYRPLIIFTTAYPNFALDGFDLGVVDYLVKPIEFSRFFKAVNKAYNQRFPKISESSGISTEKTPVEAEYMFIKVEYAAVKVRFDNILYIEGLKDYIKIYTGQRPMLTKSTMKNVVEKLPSDRFLRVHKSFIVSLSKIDSIANNRILIGEKLIPVGNQYKDMLQEVLNRFRL
jgi:two-component system, LytTR family, response regulator